MVLLGLCKFSLVLHRSLSQTAAECHRRPGSDTNNGSLNGPIHVIRNLSLDT